MVALVRTLISLRGTNQAELSRETGVSVTAISRYLNDLSEIRADALLKILSYLGADIDTLVKSEINKAIGNQDDMSIGDDIRYLLDQAPPITRKTVTDTLISSFKNDKNPNTRNRVLRLRKYKDSIRTVRRASC